jgi:hypothetical protein
MTWWELSNNVAVGASILGVFLWLASWHGARRTDRLIERMSSKTQALITATGLKTDAMIERSTANTHAILERMDQKADERQQQRRG